MSFLAAWRFLTVIPLPWRQDDSPRAVGRSIIYFPFIGLIIGLILAGFRWFVGLGFPEAVSDVLTIVMWVALTGALHLDGLVDTCDGLVGWRTVGERLASMKDSRAGSFGVIGVIILLLVKYVSISSIAGYALDMRSTTNLLLPSLVLAPVIGRWAMVYAIKFYPYALPEGLGKVFKQQANWIRFAAATVITGVIAGVVLEVNGIVLMATAWIVTMSMASYFKGKFNGLTGDNYGALCEIAETAVFLMVIFLMRIGRA